MTTPEIDISEGDSVVVRIRERGDSGPLRAKFVARVTKIRKPHKTLSEKITLDPPWSTVTGLKLHRYDAEFEVVENPEEVNF